MRLEFHSRHLSITDFPAIDLPKLSIIVGINGSGKTHLLEAIENGSISHSFPTPADQVPGTVTASQVKLLSSNPSANSDRPGFRVNPMNDAEYISAPLYDTPHSSQDSFRTLREGALRFKTAELISLLGASIHELLASEDDIWHVSPGELLKRSGSNADISTIQTLFDEASAILEAPVERRFGYTESSIHYGVEVLPALMASQKLDIPILKITEDHVNSLQPWGTDQFQFNFAALFGRYRDRYLINRLKILDDLDNGTHLGLSDERFVRAYGTPPWTNFNKLLTTFKLPYAVKAPSLNDYGPIKVKLFKNETGDEVRQENLSSGEKVLLQFAISTFTHDDGMTHINRPTLLLLDELDAPLHPEMVHRWLSAIQDGLVADQGLTCILTTHSPTTVALAPEAALFEMRNGREGLVKISKQEALNRLTFGVPTLSIDYAGRRQVFTESDTDAAIYEQVYSLIKAELSIDRELNFLSTGMRKKDGGEINSGCTIVNNIVRSLHEYGNNAVFGIVDWDGEANSTERVKVIGHGVSDGIESILLDPLLVCLLLMKLRRAPSEISDIKRFVGATDLSPADLQRMVDAVQSLALPDTDSGTTAITYIGGATVNVFTEYLTMDDHDLESAVIAAFPALEGYKKRGRGELVKAVVNEVLTEHSMFCPMSLKSVFEEIANATT